MSCSNPVSFSLSLDGQQPGCIYIMTFSKLHTKLTHSVPSTHTLASAQNAAKRCHSCSQLKLSQHQLLLPLAVTNGSSAAAFAFRHILLWRLQAASSQQCEPNSIRKVTTNTSCLLAPPTRMLRRARARGPATRTSKTASDKLLIQLPRTDFKAVEKTAHVRRPHATTNTYMYVCF